MSKDREWLIKHGKIEPISGHVEDWYEDITGPDTLDDGGNIVEIKVVELSAYHSLQQELDECVEALEKASDELGINQPGYPAPVGNANDYIKQALAKLKQNEGEG